MAPGVVHSLSVKVGSVKMTIFLMLGESLALELEWNVNCSLHFKQHIELFIYLVIFCHSAENRSSTFYLTRQKIFMGSSYLYSIYIEPLKGCCLLYTRNLNVTTCWTVCFENIHFDGKSSLSLLRLPLGLRLDSIKHCLKNIPGYKRNQTRFAYKVCVIYGFNHLDLYPKYFLFCESHSDLDKVRVKSP